MLLAPLAGVLSILSPCVLPLLPVVLTGAVVGHRLRPLALAAGVAVSFTAFGVFVTTIRGAIHRDCGRAGVHDLGLSRTRSDRLKFTLL